MKSKLIRGVTNTSIRCISFNNLAYLKETRGLTTALSLIEQQQQQPKELNLTKDSKWSLFGNTTFTYHFNEFFAIFCLHSKYLSTREEDLRNLDMESGHHNSIKKKNC